MNAYKSFRILTVVSTLFFQISSFGWADMPVMMNQPAGGPVPQTPALVATPTVNPFAQVSAVDPMSSDPLSSPTLSAVSNEQSQNAAESSISGPEHKVTAFFDHSDAREHLIDMRDTVLTINGRPAIVYVDRETGSYRFQIIEDDRSLILLRPFHRIQIDGIDVFQDTPNRWGIIGLRVPAIVFRVKKDNFWIFPGVGWEREH